MKLFNILYSNSYLTDSKLKEEVNQKAFSALEKTTSAKQGSQSSQNITSNVTVKDTGI